ncbi:TonB-dependent receptor [Methylocystis parvus]|uniref:TonB-dependent receptor plug domain-containing protein n=1 Tax=Methylocystis parvus TaxID=134 RepID=A0A6B8M0N1_9HYPH|nr:TonB-dependent receptor [Methylocystis parvus]QGM97324.1 TonB-dependent receptor plug domain-containing protein [Methylocystis parvus]WBJ98765.1 TonB-dependent receptor [Methylocystis parvus OBBP]
MRSGATATALGVAALMASMDAATAQDSSTTLPPVKVDAPREKPRPVVVPVKPKPTPVVVAKPQPAHHPAQTHAASTTHHTGPTTASARATGGGAAPAGAPAAAGPSVPLFIQAERDPYADPVAPYRAVRVQSNKFTQPIINTPRTITVLTREALDDKNATSLREIGRSTAGVTLGTGEGGNAFGDRFFIRGFDARNDIFVDGIRDPAVNVRENFYTEQVEILRGPGSSFAGRGTAGGAINIVTKQANTISDFVDMRAQGGTADQTKRVTLDVNKVISPMLAVRANGLFQDANVAGRSFVTDDRNGAAGSVVFKPLENLTFTAQYTHVYQNGLPDFGVPYNRARNRPYPEGVTPRYVWYGLINRDFSAYSQDFGTFTATWRYNENLTLSSRLRQGRSVIDYVGTLTQNSNLAARTVTIGAQSRYQVTNVLANQTDANIKFDTGPIKHEAVTGVEFSREGVTRTNYQGLNSEFNGQPIVAGQLNCNIYLPCTYLPFTNKPYLNPNFTRIAVDTASGYVIETANYQDIVIANAGVRFDDYTITNRNETYTTFAANHSFMTNYNAGLVLKPMKDVSLYTAYATSTNPVGAELDGGAANYGGLTTAVQIFPPQYNRAKEIGVKWQAMEHLLATLALFRTDVSNAREVNSGVTTGNSAYYVQGVDLEVAGNITDRWSMIGGLVIMESKVKQSPVWTNVGLQLANIAHESFSLLSKYKFGDLIGLDLDGLEVGGQAVYRSKIYGGNNIVANGATALNAAFWPAPTAANPFVNVPTILPSYWRFDVFAEANISKNVGMKLTVSNLFNRTYYDAFYQTAAPYAQMAPGRAVYLETHVNF